jgi:leucyl aminopeptidase
MPLGDAYDKQIKSDIADMKNVGGRQGGFHHRGAVPPALRGRQRRQGQGQGRRRQRRGHLPWAHLDIAGTAWTTKDLPSVPKGATGFGVRLLDRNGGRALRGLRAAGLWRRSASIT